VARGKKPLVDAPLELDNETKAAIWAWVREEYPRYASRDAMRQLWNRCRTYHTREGHVFADWGGALQSWIVIQYERDTGLSAPSKARGAALSRHVEAVGKKNKHDAESLAESIGGLFAINGGKR
jgi:hypothetical protein